MSNKKMMINVISSLCVLCTNLIISFWLSPYIVRNIGVEANGFVNLANNFVMYAQLIVLALNSMAARFISIEYNKKNYDKANLYYNSVFWGNLLIVLVLIVPAIILILKLDSFVNIPSSILFDVKLLFSFIFFNFFLQTGLPNWDCGVFVSNRMDRLYIPQMISSVIKCILIVGLFTFLTPKVYYVSIGVTVYTIIVLICNWYNTHTLTPKLNIKIKKSEVLCSKTAIKELVGAGIWSTISNVGVLLLSGLDLIICNILLGATSMGVLSLAKIVPSYLEQLSSQIRNALMPELTINYAIDSKEKLLHNLNNSMKITMVIMTIPLSLFIVFGNSFFKLWIPSQDSNLLWILSILSVLSLLLTTGTQILYNVFDVANKVKYNAIALIISGIISLVLTLLVVKFFGLGIYAVAGVSSIVNIIRNMIFTLPVTAKMLGFKWNQFYNQVFNSMKCIMSILIIGFILKNLFIPNSFVKLIVSLIVTGTIGIIINFFIVLNKSERKILMMKIKRG